MNIQNILARPGYRDTIYGTGEWEPFEIKDVPDAIGRKMIEHTDVYFEIPAELIPDGLARKVTIPAVFVEDELQEFYDKLTLMTKDQMRDFVETKFNMKVDMRKFQTDDALRAHTRMLVEQYGAL